MKKNKLIKLTNIEFKKLRKKQWRKQKKHCAILKQKIPYDKAVFDHKHKTKAEVLGEDGKGLLRGVLHSQTNVMEGKIANMYKRYGLHKFITLPKLLRNIADYLEKPPMKQEYIHPKENPKPEKLMKRDYNKICKYYFHIYPSRRVLPKYPKKGRTNKTFKNLLIQTNNYELNKKNKKINVLKKNNIYRYEKNKKK